MSALLLPQSVSETPDQAPAIDTTESVTRTVFARVRTALHISARYRRDWQTQYAAVLALHAPFEWIDARDRELHAFVQEALSDDATPPLTATQTVDSWIALNKEFSCTLGTKQPSQKEIRARVKLLLKIASRDGLPSEPLA